MFPFESQPSFSYRETSPSGQEGYRQLKRAHAFRLALVYLAPLVVLTVFLYLQYDAVVSEGQRIQMKSVAEGQASMLDLFLSARIVNLSNLLADADLYQLPTSELLADGLEHLQRESDAFVDLSFIDSSGLQIAYAGPYRELIGRDYRSQPWYMKLKEDGSDSLITDIYPGYRQVPHFTIAVKRVDDGQMLVLRATLDPGRIYDALSFREGARLDNISTVNKDGLYQLVNPSFAPLEKSLFVPPSSPRAGWGSIEQEGSSIEYAYSWMRNVDWAVVLPPSPRDEWSTMGFRAWLFGLLAAIILLGLVAVNARAEKIVEAHLESERTKAQLAERVKELACLYGVGRLVEKHSASLDEVLRGVVELVRQAWRFPEIACVRLRLDESDYTTSPWNETARRQIVELNVDGKKAGFLEVGYMEERLPVDDIPFLAEERELLHAVAARLGRVIERTRTEEKRAMLATAVEHAAESITITDVDGIIEYVNPAFTVISGYTREEVIGRNPRFLKSGKHDRAFYEDLWKTILSGRTWTGRFTNKKKDGSLYEVDCRISPVRDERGRIIRFVAVKHDVTEMVELEASLRQAQKMEAVGQLAGGVAHDFNNILTVILTNAHYLLKAVDESSPMRQDVEEIKQSGERAAALTRQLLAFSRRQVVEPEVLDLSQVLEGTEKLLRRLIGEDIELETISSSDLGLVYVDPAQIEQVILNLAVNARDAMPKGGKLTIETGNELLDKNFVHLHSDLRPGRYVMLKVSDTGHGMDEETLSRIFEPFFTTKEQSGGTGLGLATVYGVVKQAEGHILVTSEVDKGTVFRIFLPRVDPERRSEWPAGRGEDALQGSETILVVEDDDTVRKTAVRILEDHHYTVLQARNGKDALDICENRTGAIDLLLTDLVMPEMGGWELSELAAAWCPEIKVVFMSGYAKEERASLEVPGPERVFVQKPLIPDELARRVRDALDGK